MSIEPYQDFVVRLLEPFDSCVNIPDLFWSRELICSIWYYNNVTVTSDTGLVY